MTKKVIATCLIGGLIITPPLAIVYNTNLADKVGGYEPLERVVKAEEEYKSYRYMEEQKRLIQEHLVRYERQQQEKRAREEQERRKASRVRYNPNNLRELSGATEEQIKYALKDFRLEPLSKSLSKVEERYGINVLFMIGLIRQESGNGTSYLAKANNNLGGVKSSSDRGGYKDYPSWSHSLQDICRLIDNEYLSPGGKFYNGTGIWNVNKLYCENKDWADKINSIAYESRNKINGREW